jgi:hypothetical protein
MRSKADKARLCAANNADIYQSVFRAHGLKDHRSEAMWRSEETAPPYYSNLTTLDPDASDVQLAAIEELKLDLNRPFSVKDGFRGLDLSRHGFRLLFGATWIWAEPDSLGPLNSLPAGWRRIGDAASLEAWESAWAAGGSPRDRRVFPKTILDDPAIAILGRVANRGFDAGCVANRSPEVVGLSNVFSTNEPAPVIYETAVIAASAFAPGLPMVGYDRGEALLAARATGFEAVGDLRVWLFD